MLATGITLQRVPTFRQYKYDECINNFIFTTDMILVIMIIFCKKQLSSVRQFKLSTGIILKSTTYI